MRMIRKAEDRGHFDFGWLDTHHSFSFGEYFDPDHHHYRALRVLNEDRVLPGQGFGTHGHRDMEILTWVLEGALEHRDSLGTRGVIRPGEAQIMSAGRGIQHSEFNASATAPVHFLQIWLLPEAKDMEPRYDQIGFGDEELRNRWRLIASRNAENGSVRVFQDLKVFASRLDSGAELLTTLADGRFGYLHVAKGKVQLDDGIRLESGDALRVEAEAGLGLRGETACELLWFELA